MTVATAPAPLSHPSTHEVAISRRRHYLFGYPIAHSASPAFQNALWHFLEERMPAVQSNEGEEHLGRPTYSLCETKSIDESHFYKLVRHDPLHGGSGVTMPLKVAVAAKLGPQHILDELDSIGQATLTVNTIVVRPAKDGDTSLSRRRMVGTNTDCLGIRHALLRDLAVQNGVPAGSLIGSTSEQGPYVFPQSNVGGKPYSAFIIGSGGTCRSAVWAMHNLGLSPLYLLNRDEQETQDVVRHFASMDIDLRPLHSLESYAHEKKLRDEGKVGKVACAVGAIPAFEPVTPGEKMVYTLAHAFFKEPYEAHGTATNVPVVPAAAASTSLPYRTFDLPTKRPFLDMCYKPRLTPLLQFAGTQTTTWSPIGGVEAMVEQGLAQARMWAASSAILNSSAKRCIDTATGEVDDALAYATKAGDGGPLGLECEEQARRMVQSMSDVVVPPTSLSIPTFAISAMTNNMVPGLSKQPQSVH